MAGKKNSLGRGLDALFAENAMENNDANVQTLRIAEIEPNRDQPRKQFNETALADLAESISQHGVLQPLLVRPLTDGTYQLVAGERRWRASRMAGLTEVPVVIREMNDREAAELALIENLQRQDLNPIEEAKGYRTLMDTYGLTQEEAAQSVNKSRPAVANALRLLNLPEAVLDMVSDGVLSSGHARTILAFETQEEQLAAAKTAKENDLSVRALEKMAKAAKKQKNAVDTLHKNSVLPKTLYSEVELALSEQLGKRVKVTDKGKGGTLSIDFNDDEDLKALANRFK